jgi:hypothetical protein
MVDVVRDADFYLAQARDARSMARTTDDRALANRFKETAIQHERQARKLNRAA